LVNVALDIAIPYQANKEEGLNSGTKRTSSPALHVVSDL